VGSISQALASVEVAGQALAFFSPTTTNPRGIKNLLHTVSPDTGSFTLQALAGCLGSLLLEQTGEFTSPTTAYPVGMGDISNSDPFHDQKPLHTISLGPGLLMNQALVRSFARVLRGQFESKPSCTNA
jgi:hypothetical protein